MFLCLSYTHVISSVLALAEEDSPRRDCPSVSWPALLVTLLLLVSVSLTMIHRSAYGYRLSVDLVNTTIGIGAGSVLQMLAKGRSWHASANDQDVCSLLVYVPSLYAWLVGEVSSFVSGAILVLRWRRSPPANLPKTVAVGGLIATGVGLYFLTSILISPALATFYDFNSSRVEPQTPYEWVLSG